MSRLGLCLLAQVWGELQACDNAFIISHENDGPLWVKDDLGELGLLDNLHRSFKSKFVDARVHASVDAKPP